MLPGMDDAAAGSAGRVVDFSNREDVTRWFRRQSRDWAVALAARAALRVLPLAWAGIVNSYDGTARFSRRSLMLTLFRATASALLAAKFRKSGPRRLLGGSDAPNAAHAALNIATEVNRGANAAFEQLRTSDSAREAERSSTHANELFVAGAVADACARASICAVGDPVFDAADAIARAIDATRTRNGTVDVSKACNLDSEFLMERADAPALCDKPLWEERAPRWAQKAWNKAKPRLLRNDEDWDVWTRWYDALLEGREPESEAMAIARVSLPEEIWAQGPKVVNAAIKRLEEEEIQKWLGEETARMHRQFGDPLAPTKKAEPQQTPLAPPSIPLARTAALEPVIRSNTLKLPKTAAKTDLKGESPTAALKALKRQMASLSAALKDETNIDKRIIAYLDTLEMAVPEKRPRQVVVFELGHEIRLLQGYANQVNAEWPELLAQRYHAMTLGYERTIRQFPKWREFYANAAKDTLAPEQIEKAPEAAKAVIEALRASDVAAHVDADLTEAVQTIAERLVTSDATKEEIAADLLESLSNIFKAVAVPALAGAKAYTKSTSSGFVEAAGKQGKKDGASVFKWTRKIILACVSGGIVSGGTLLANWLGLTFPHYFTWLPPVAAFLATVVYRAKKTAEK